MGSSSSRHASQAAAATGRRGQGDYPSARRDGAGNAAALPGGPAPVEDALGRFSEAARGRSGRERSRSRFRPGRFGSTRHHHREARHDEAPAARTSDPAPVTIVGRRSSSSSKEGSSSSKEGSSSSAAEEVRIPADRSTSGGDQLATSWAAGAAGEGSSSRSTASVSGSGSGQPAAPPEPSTRTPDTGRPSVGLVVEIVPVSMLAPEREPSANTGSSTDGGGPSQGSSRTSSSDSRWTEVNSPWTSSSGAGTSEQTGGADGSSSTLAGLSPSTRQNLQAVCETTVQDHRVNEMQERLRRYAGLPPSLDIHDLERRGILSAESSSGSQSQRTGTASSSMSGSERDDFPIRAAPASLQAWEITEEGRLIEYRHSVYSEPWDRHLDLRRSDSRGSTIDRGSADRPSASSGSAAPLSAAAGRESRRNGGRRLWDTLTRAASHRRTSTPSITPPAAESVVDGWAQRDDHIDFQAFHSRSRDLEERRRRVRSQVWALQLLSNGLEGMPGLSRPCTAGGHHHGHCSCEVHSSAEESSTRASISRIIMLAEALFEVLDEIHRQSIALSRTSAPIASLPAPDNVVNAIPTRKFVKKLWEEATQCNICLVEYEEGDQVRVLPCHHEYHVACVDKWLKEVHRVCPLCRGNVCELNSATESHLFS